MWLYDHYLTQQIRGETNAQKQRFAILDLLYALP